MDTPDTPHHSKTIPEFCETKRISRSTYYKLKRRGLGPDTFNIPGLRLERITSQAEAEWDERMLELAKSEAAQVEAQRRQELAAIAGRAAAKSPLHVSKRGAIDQRRQKRARR
jgi:hypothetical protein